MINEVVYSVISGSANYLLYYLRLTNVLLPITNYQLPILSDMKRVYRFTTHRLSYGCHKL